MHNPPDNPIDLIRRFRAARATNGYKDKVHKNLLGQGRMQGEASAFSTCIKLLEGDQDTIFEMFRYIEETETWQGQ